MYIIYYIKDNSIIFINNKLLLFYFIKMLHGYDIKITDEDLNDSDKEESGDWTEEAFSFINEVIFGIEREVYKKAMENNEIKKTIKETSGMLIGSRLLEFYLTQVYRQLIEKKNDMILERFTKMGKICDEKPIFMLNLVSNVINKVYPMMPRSKLDPDDENKYSQSVMAILLIMKNYIVSDLKDYLKKLKEAKKTMKKEELDIMDGKMKIPK